MGNGEIQLGESSVAPLPMADFLESSNAPEELKTSNVEDQLIDKDSQGNDVRVPLDSAIDEDFSLPNMNDEALDRWEAVPLQLTEADLARDSEAILKEDEAGSNSLARQELLEEMNAMKDYMDLQKTNDKNDEDEGGVAENKKIVEGKVEKKPEGEAVGGLLEIYNVDDFDEKFDDETLLQA